MKELNLKQLFIHYGIPILLFIIFVEAIIMLNRIEKNELVNRTGQTFEKGVVTEILRDNTQEDGIRTGQQTVKVKMRTGEKKGEEVITTSSSGYLFGADCEVGTKVVVMQSVAGDSVVSSVYSRDRGSVLIIFALLYILALCIIGGAQGIKGALGLIFTFAGIIYIYVPLVYLGFPPVFSAVLICAVTAVVTLWFIGGLTRKTLAATAGTVTGVAIAGVAALLFSKASGITGWNVSDIESLLTLWTTNEIQVGGLLFAGLIISSLGAVMDVAMSISSAMSEICSQNPEISRGELFKSGMRIGRDMMGTDSNTLILAFAGTSLSMLVMNYAYDLPFLQIINSNNIGIAVMQGLAGSFGVVLSVPATVAIAAWIYKP